MSATGRHSHKALTARAVSTTTEPGRYADGGGLYLLVAPGGSKSWVLRTVVKGRRCDIGLGSVELVSLADGREEARRLRRIARAGGDPLAERRQERRPVPSFEDAAKAVHTAHAASFKRVLLQRLGSRARVRWVDLATRPIRTPCGSGASDRPRRPSPSTAPAPCEAHALSRYRGRSATPW